MEHVLTFDNMTCDNKESCRLRTPIFQQRKDKSARICSALDIVTNIQDRKYMFIPCNVDSEKQFAGQSLFALDMDNQHNLLKSYTDILNCYGKYGITPFMIYETYSSTDMHKKYRVLFRTGTDITTLTARNQILAGLIYCTEHDYPDTVDKRCTDLGRIFYPGKETVYVNYDAYVFPYQIKNVVQELINHVSSNSQLIQNVKNNLPSLFKNKITDLINHEDDIVWEGVSYFNPQVVPYNNILVSLYKLSYTYMTLPYTYTTKDMGTGVNVCTPYSDTVIGGQNYTDFSPKQRNQVVKFILQNIPLNEILDTDQTICCILHDDKHPSALLYRQKNGTYQYFCNSCKKGFDLFSYIRYELQKLTYVPLTYGDIFTWLLKLLKLPVTDDLTEQLINNASMYLKRLPIPLKDDFQAKYPKLFTRLYHTDKHLHVLHYIVRSAIASAPLCKLSDMEDPCLYVSFGYKKIAENINAKRQTEYNEYSVRMSIRFLIMVGLLEFMKEDKIPDNLYKKLVKDKGKKKYTRHTNVYKIPYFTEDLFIQAEKILTDNRNQCASSLGYSRDQLLCRDKNNIQADKQYPQDTRRKMMSSRTQEFYNILLSLAKQRFSEKSYTSMQELKNAMKEYYQCSNASVNKRFAKTMPGVMKELDLARTPYSESAREFLDITETTYRGSTWLILPRQAYEELEKKKKQDRDAVREAAYAYLTEQLKTSPYVLWRDLRPHLESIFTNMKPKRLTDTFNEGFEELVQELEQNHKVHIEKTVCDDNIRKQFKLDNPINASYIIFVFRKIQTMQKVG